MDTTSRKIFIITFRKVSTQIGPFKNVQIIDQSLINHFNSFSEKTDSKIIKYSICPAEKISFIKIRTNKDGYRKFLNCMRTATMRQFITVKSFN